MTLECIYVYAGTFANTASIVYTVRLIRAGTGEE